MYAQRNYGCRISEVYIYGTKVIILENECLRISVLAGKGADIYELLDKKTDTDFMFRERRGLDRLNGFIPTITTKQGSFWDYSVGGWFEMLPNCGNPSSFAGAEIGLHGEVCLQPWDVSVECDSVDYIKVVFSVRTKRTPFLLKRVMGLRRNSGVLSIQETVENESSVATEFLWGHHVTIGEGFLNENCVIDIPNCKVVSKNEYNSPASRLAPNVIGNWYRMLGKDGLTYDESLVLGRESGVSEMLFATEMEEAWFSVTDRKRKVGIGVSWDQMVFPAMWIWKEYCGCKEYPFYGDTYAIALEPQVSDIPMLHDASKAGETIKLDGNKKISTWITASIFYDDRSVKKVSECGTIQFI